VGHSNPVLCPITKGKEPTASLAEAKSYRNEPLGTQVAYMIRWGKLAIAAAKILEEKPSSRAVCERVIMAAYLGITRCRE
jgi:hypothetical protein